MEIKILKNVSYDVAVVGGGTAGVFAAVSAAAAGARTVLIEKNGVLGGTSTVGGINYPGLFFAWGKQIIAGHCWNAIKRMESLGFCRIPEIAYERREHWLEQIRYNTFAYCAVLDELCAEHGVEVCFHSMLTAAEEQEDGVTLLITQKDGVKQVEARIVIDATGDANLVQMLGYPCMESAQLQPSTLSVSLGGYDPNAVDVEALTAELASGLEAGVLPAWTVPATVARGVFKKELRFHVPTPKGSDTSDQKSLLEISARRDAFSIICFLRTCRGLSSLCASEFSNECGVRETKRVLGEYVITAEDYISGKHFDDAVCYAFYPIDLHIPPYDVKQQYFSPEHCATVPYRALIPKGASRILVAGRILSSDTDANSALRVQAPCMAMGQAAGCAAAIAARQGVCVSDVEYQALCRELTRQGAIVPL